VHKQDKLYKLLDKLPDMLNSLAMLNPILFIVCFSALLIGTVTDIKRREVPDWVSYGLVFSGVWINLIISIVTADFHFVLNSIIGLTVFWFIALLMFYTAQWGGGDSKVLMGIGAIIGIPLSFPISETFSNWLSDPFHNLPLLFYFLAFTMLIGSIYGIAWSVIVSVKNYRLFKADFLARLKERKVVICKWIVLILAIALLISAIIAKDALIRTSFLGLGLIIVSSFYLFLYIKSVEKVCMQKYVKPSELTEGDWIVEDIVIDKKIVASPKDLGVSKEQIEHLIQLYKKGRVSKVLIKEGIPFVPSFLLGLVAAVIYVWLF
jgi:hypothetical protein